MKLIRTAKIKLDISIKEILPTFQAYTKAYNFVCKRGFEDEDKNTYSLHKKTYREIRNILPAELAITSRMKASESLTALFSKKQKYYSCPKSKLISIRHDVRSYSLNFKTNIVSILTINKRKKVPLIIPEYYKTYFADWKYTSADLCIKKNKIYLHVCFQKEIPDILPSENIVGLDRGINKLAVTSNNQFFGGGIIKKIVKKRQKLRNKLQSKGTKSAKRHLKRISGKEKRFRADINHQISKKIINSLNPGDTLVLEDLTGIRNRRLRKEMRTLIHGWSFYQLEQFLKYKSEARGIKIAYVEAYYTSQCCSKCGHTAKNNRKTQSKFCCMQCGFKLNADLNASRNIRNKYLFGYMLANKVVINQPIVSTEMLDASC